MCSASRTRYSHSIHDEFFIGCRASISVVPTLEAEDLARMKASGPCSPASRQQHELMSWPIAAAGVRATALIRRAPGLGGRRHPADIRAADRGHEGECKCESVFIELRKIADRALAHDASGYASSA